MSSKNIFYLQYIPGLHTFFNLLDVLLIIFEYSGFTKHIIAMCLESSLCLGALRLILSIKQLPGV